MSEEKTQAVVMYSEEEVDQIVSMTVGRQALLLVKEKLSRASLPMEEVIYRQTLALVESRQADEFSKASPLVQAYAKKAGIYGGEETENSAGEV